MNRKLWSSPQLWWVVLASSRTLAWNTGLVRSTSYSGLVKLPTLPFVGSNESYYSSILRLYSSTSGSGNSINKFETGEKIQVEVVSFGPLGASVQVVGRGHDAEGLIAVNDEPLGTGLILQMEIGYFRQARNNVDVVRGEVLPAYVQHIREDGKIDIGLRSFGGKAKSEEVGDMVLKRLEWVPGGTIPIGDKSSPNEVNAVFPGVSKSAFKKAVGALYRKGLVQPSDNSVTLTKKK
jgi:CvfB-like winged helix domain